MISTKEILKLVVIKSNKLFISDDITGSYYNTKITNLLVDDKKLKPTYLKNWFEIDEFPQKIEEIIPSKKINVRYELKDEYKNIANENTPPVIYEYINNEDSEFYDIRGLYEQKFDVTEETTEEIPFEIVILDEIDNFKLPETPKFNVDYHLIDKLQTHPVLLHLKPCQLTEQQTYEIIRNYIKNNIDLKYAKITSDYNFCFTVKKIITLAKKESYKVDVNNKLFGKKRKPKYETKYRTDRDVIIFEMTHEHYKEYPQIQPFKGKNYKDLLHNIGEYLNKLIKEINEPLIDCPHCNGTGVVKIDSNILN